MDDDVVELDPLGPDDGGRDRAEGAEGGGGRRVPARNAGRWVTASTGHLVCVEEPQP